jgi:hypothetical protein
VLCVIPGAESKSSFLKGAKERYGEQEHVWTCSSKKRHKCKCQLKTITRPIPSNVPAGEGEFQMQRTWVCAFIHEAHNHNDNEDATPYGWIGQEGKNLVQGFAT